MRGTRVALEGRRITAMAGCRSEPILSILPAAPLLVVRRDAARDLATVQSGNAWRDVGVSVCRASRRASESGCKACRRFRRKWRDLRSAKPRGNAISADMIRRRLDVKARRSLEARELFLDRSRAGSHRETTRATLRSCCGRLPGTTQEALGRTVVSAQLVCESIVAVVAMQH